MKFEIFCFLQYFKNIPTLIKTQKYPRVLVNTTVEMGVKKKPSPSVVSFVAPICFRELMSVKIRTKYYSFEKEEKGGRLEAETR